MARANMSVTSGTAAFFVTLSVTSVFVFSTLFWLVFGPLNYVVIVILSSALIVSSLFFAPPTRAQSIASAKSLLLALLILSSIAFVLLIDERQPYAFDTWDAVVSWNRWAEELMRGEYVPYQNPYPILWPTLWSLIYSAQGTEFVQIWTKHLQLVIVVLTVLVAWELGRKKSIFAAGTFLLILAASSNELLSKFTHGYMDEPVAVLIATAVVSFVLFDEQANSSLEQKLIWLLPFWLLGLAAVTKQAGWPLLFVGLVIATFDFRAGTVNSKLFMAALVGLLIPLMTFLFLFLTHVGAAPPRAGAIDVLVGLSAANTEIEGNFQRGFSWLLSMKSLSDAIRLFGTAVMLGALFFLRGRIRLVVLLTALLVIVGSIGTGICCSYDDRNSKWLVALSIAGITCVLSALSGAKIPDRLTRHIQSSKHFSAWNEKLSSPLLQLDNRMVFASLPCFLVFASVVERAADPYIHRSMSVMQTLGGKASAVALKNDIEQSEDCAVVFSAYPMVRHNPILANHRDKMRGGGSLSWYLHSGRSIDVNCRTYWYLKPGTYPQASEADKLLFKEKLANGSLVQLDGYAYRVSDKSSQAE